MLSNIWLATSEWLCINLPCGINLLESPVLSNSNDGIDFYCSLLPGHLLQTVSDSAVKYRALLTIRNIKRTSNPRITEPRISAGPEMLILSNNLAKSGIKHSLLQDLTQPDNCSKAKSLTRSAALTKPKSHCNNCFQLLQCSSSLIQTTGQRTSSLFCG